MKVVVSVVNFGCKDSKSACNFQPACLQTLIGILSAFGAEFTTLHSPFCTSSHCKDILAEGKCLA